MERESGYELDTRTMTAGDFVLGIVHRLAERNGGKYWFNVYDLHLHRAMLASQVRLLEIAEQHGVDADFRIGLDPIHGDSATIKQELSMMLFHNTQVYGHYGSYVNLIYDAEHPMAEHVKEILPGPEELYEELATVFTAVYENRTRTS